MRPHAAINQSLPYALNVKTVTLRPDGKFVFGDPSSDKPLVIEARDLVSCVEPTKAKPRIDGDDVGVEMRLYGQEHFVPELEAGLLRSVEEYAALPTGEYTLEITVPLFSTGWVTSVARGKGGMHVQTRGRGSTWVEYQADGMPALAGLQRNFGRQWLWAIYSEPVSVLLFEAEMGRRMFWLSGPVTVADDSDATMEEEDEDEEDEDEDEEPPAKAPILVWRKGQWMRY